MNDECCICHCSNIDFITKCNHKMHLNCLNTWLNIKNTCPLCRTNLNDENEYIEYIEYIQYIDEDDEYNTSNINSINSINIVNAFNNNGESALSIAVMNNDIESIKRLIKMGADINIKNDNNVSALSLAINNNQFNCINLFINLGLL